MLEQAKARTEASASLVDSTVSSALASLLTVPYLYRITIADFY